MKADKKQSSSENVRALYRRIGLRNSETGFKDEPGSGKELSSNSFHKQLFH